MALGAETVRRQFPAGDGGDEEASAGAAPLFLTTGKDRPVNPMVWGDEKRMKRELVAWAKAVASTAARKNMNMSSSQTTRHRVATIGEFWSDLRHREISTPSSAVLATLAWACATEALCVY